MLQRLNWLALILMLSITFLLISDATASKIIFLFGLPVSISVLYFPVTYILADIVTEVYGYRIARQIMWMSILCSVAAGLIYQLAAYVPAAFPRADGIDPYREVFSMVPRIMVAGWLAVFAGDIANNYVLAKMKLWTKGRHFWARAIGSTVAGQGVNSIVFYPIAFIGIMPVSLIMTAIATGWLFKVCVEILLLPATYQAVKYLKKVEQRDTFDEGTDFNPFLFK